MHVASLIVAAAMAVALPAAAQDPATHQHQSMVMGFDQQATTHHFYLYEDGGAINVSVNDPADLENLAGIQRHLQMLPAHFGAGDFSMPEAVHEGTTVTAAADLARLKEAIVYRYAETERGGRIEIVAAGTEALAAVHAFLRFQISDHKTGDSTDVTARK
jgi:hypothetical protein